MSSDRKPVTAFILSLLSGVFIIVVGLMCLWMGSFMGFDWMDWMMHNWGGQMHFWGFGGFASIMNILRVVFGIVIVVASMMLYSNPRQHVLWGGVIIAFSAISLISCLGGMGVGLLLGTAGGVLALLWRP